MAVIKTKTKTGKIRNPFYELGDKIGKLEDVANELKDSKLRALVIKLAKDRDALRKYINIHYLWD
jgi:hypothetical protein